MNFELFSQSLYINSSSQSHIEFKSDSNPNPTKSKKWPFFKNIQNNLPEIEKYNPMINKDMALKYSFNKVMMDFEKSMKETDLNKTKAPFLPHTLQVWRQEAWEKLQKNLKNLNFENQQKWKRKFIGKIDGDYLIKYFRSMKEPYFNLIFFENYHMPLEIKEGDIKKDNYLCKKKVFIKLISLFSDSEIMDFSVHIANWCTQIELAADIILRAELYGLYNVPEKK